ncbi:MAG: FliA/WhiG family RNA polymerase sigma factor [Candidatus Eisenbacteria bacterium]
MTPTIQSNPYVQVAQAEREQRILSHLPLVRRIAHALGARLPRRIDLADVVSAGTVGLIRAVDRFDESRGLPLETYAGRCIRQSILGFLRSLDPLPYSTRVKIRRLEASAGRLQGALGRMPTDEEIGEEIGMDAAEVSNLMAQATSLALFSWSENGDRRPEKTGDGGESDTVLDVIERQEIRDILASRVRDLPRTERTVLMLYYYEGLKMKEIGELFGVTESRISQIHGKALTVLRAHLRRILES